MPLSPEKRYPINPQPCLRNVIRDASDLADLSEQCDKAVNALFKVKDVYERYTDEFVDIELAELCSTALHEIGHRSTSG